MNNLFARLKIAIKKNKYIYLKGRLVRIAIQRFRYSLKYADKTTYLAGKSKISRDIVIGPNSYIGPDAQICPGVKLGAYVMFGPSVMIVGRDHRIDLPGVPMIFSGRPEFESTTIDDDVWVGARATIIAGVNIGRGAVIGAGALVTKDIPPYAIALGVPARVVKFRFNDNLQAIHDAMLITQNYHGTFCDDITSSTKTQK